MPHSAKDRAYVALRTSFSWLSLSLCAATLFSTRVSAEVPDRSAIEVQAEEVSQAERIAEFYASQAEAVWTYPAGLSPAGEVAIRWLRDAPNHGLEGFALQLQAVDEHLALLVF